MRKAGSIILFIILFISGKGIIFGQLPQLTVQTGHTDAITTLVFSSNGRYLASAGKDNLIIIWDFNLGKQIHRLQGHSSTINCMKFFGSGNRLASGGADGKLLIWDIEKEAIIEEMKGTGIKNIVSFDIMPDEKNLIFCSDSQKVFNWNSAANTIARPEFETVNSAVLEKYKSDKSEFLSVKFLPGEKKTVITSKRSIFIFSDNPSLCRYLGKSATGCLEILPGFGKIRNFEWAWADDEAKDIVYSNVKNKDKTKKRKGRTYSQVIRWNAERGKELFARSSDYSKYKFTSGSVNSDKSLIAAGNEDNNIYLWDYASGKKLKELSGHTGSVSVLLFHPEKKNLLISCDSERDILIWDTGQGKVIRKLSSTTAPVTALAVDGSESKIAFATTDNSVRIFDLNENVKLSSFKSSDSNISGISFIPGDKGFVTTGTDNRITFYNSEENNTVSKLHGNTNPALFNTVLHAPLLAIFANSFTGYYFMKALVLNDLESLNTMAVTRNKSLTAAGGTGFRSGYFYKILSPRLIPINVISNESQKKAFTLKGHYISVDALAFNSEGSILASAGNDFMMNGKTYLETLEPGKFNSPFKSNFNKFNAIKIWDTDKRKLMTTFENVSPVQSMVFEAGNDTLLFSDENRNIVLFDYKTNKSKRLQTGMGPLLFLPGDNSFIYQDLSYSVKQADIDNNQIIREFKGHTDKITSAVLLNNGKRLLTSGWDGTLKLWDVEAGKEIVTLYAIKNSDFLIKTPDNYYFATKDAVNEIGFTSGMKFYPFEQFDLKYNRPDLVLRQLGNCSEELLAAYYRAYQKRIKKLGFTEEMLSDDFHVPEIRIENLENIEPVTDSRDLVLKIKASDSRYSIDRINIWINDVALFGRNGIDKRTFASTAITEDLTIQLASGINKIQVSALNQKGAESLKEIVEVNYQAPQVKPDLYLISLGISKYRDSRFNLNYASKDATDISNLFTGDTTLFRHVYSKTFTDEQVTLTSLDEIRDFVRKAQRDDVVMLFIAGHGLLDVNLDYYFGTYDMDFNDPSGRGIIYDDIEDLFDGITALKKILFMDTCFSGEVDKDEVELAQNASTEFGNVTFRSAGAGVRMKEAFGTENTAEIMKELFTDIRKGTGSTVISSAGGAEFAMEGGEWKNGLFTFCVLNGINKKAADTNKDGNIMLSELQNYVRENVTRLSGGRQSPTSRIQNISMDFRIW